MTSALGVKFHIPEEGEQDVRNYIRPAPVPVQSHVGVKMRARTSIVYHPSEPTREQVRKENYARRFRQLSAQGFCTPAWKPYHSIGDGVVMDDKQLILDTLGQKEVERQQPPGDEADRREDKRAKHVNPSLFIASTKKTKINLKEELLKSEQIRKRMEVGGSYFEFLQRENEARAAERIRLEQLKRHKARTEPQAPKAEALLDQDGDSEDDDRSDSDEERNFIDEHSVVIHSQAEAAEAAAAAAANSKKSSEKDCHIRKRTKPPRPFTPIHVNIGDNPEESPLCSAHDPADEDFVESLFMQLCSLHWLLEAMLMDDPTLMRPIATSWSARNIGGSSISTRDRERMAHEKKDWDCLVAGKGRHRISKLGGGSSSSSAAGLYSRRSTKIWSSMRSEMSGGRSSSRSRMTSYRSAAASTGSGQPLDTSDSRAPSRASSISGEGSHTGRGSTDYEEQQAGGIWKRLMAMSATLNAASSDAVSTDEAFNDDDTMTIASRRSSLRPESSGADRSRRGSVQQQQQQHKRNSVSAAAGDDTDIDADGSSNAPMSPLYAKPSTSTAKAMTRKELAERARAIGDDLDAEQSVYAEWKRFRQNFRDDELRPVSAPVKIDKSKFLSEVKKDMIADMRVQLQLRKDERNMELQDRLSHMQRHRDRVSRMKFAAIPPSSAPHRAIKAVRSAAAYEESPASRRRGQVRRVSIVAGWYDALMKLVPDEAVDHKNIRLILDKLYQMATMASSKHTLLKFFKVLETLKEWEICSPQVCAAIEFVRSQVLDIGEEEFEKWFAQSFPSVLRQAATKASAASKKNSNLEGSSTEQRAQDRLQQQQPQDQPAKQSVLKKPSATAEDAAVPDAWSSEVTPVLRKQRPLTAV